MALCELELDGKPDEKRGWMTEALKMMDWRSWICWIEEDTDDLVRMEWIGWTRGGMEWNWT